MADKFLNLTAVQAIKTWAVGLFAKDADLDTLSDRVDEIVAEGGEPNVIEIVKKNGTALTPDANKAVDISVPTIAKSGSGETEKVTLTEGQNTYDVPTVDAMEDYVSEHGGVIQKVKYDGTELTIDATDKSVDIPKEVFVAEYDSTTKETLSEAISDEKLIVINYSGEFYTTVYSAETASYIGLYAIAGNASLYFTVNSSNVWTRTETVLATESDIPTKVSDLTNDGDGTTDSRFATEAYVEENGGKIQKVKYDGTELPIDTTDKSVNVPRNTFTAVENTTSFADLASAFNDNKIIRILTRIGAFLYPSMFLVERAGTTINSIKMRIHKQNRFTEYSVNSSGWTYNDNLATMALASDIPTNVSDLTNDSGYQTASEVQSAIASGVASVVKLKGAVATYADLPSTGNVHGDMYDTLDTGRNYVWIYDESTQTGRWDDYAGTMDLSAYWISTAGQTNTLEAATVSEINAILNAS